MVDRVTERPFEPKSFGRYQLTELLAIGGMAEIFKAKVHGAHGFEKTLVIKRILPHLAADREFVDMFIDEAKLMVQLNHPKIVQVIDFGEVDDQYFMALEYVEGIDGLAMLRRCAQRRCRPTTGIVLQIIADLLDALHYAHNLRGPDGASLGVVHRDISPSNVFISWLGEVKLGDFGIARAAVRRGHTESGALKGKYGYMAPEQATGAAIDHRADVFAVGVVLAELLMIRRLFYAKNDLEILLQVRDAKLDRLDLYGARIPADLRAILESALARDPNLRYQSAASFRDALHRYLFDNRRMVRSVDVRRFLVRLTEEEGPLRVEDRVDSLEVRLPGEGRHPTPQSAAVRGGAAAEQDPSAPVAAQRSGVDPANGGGPAAKEAERSADLSPPAFVGRKRRIVVTPPPMPLPVPTGLPQTGEEPRIGTADALAAMPEMFTDASSSHFDLGGSTDLEGSDADVPVLPGGLPDQDPAPPTWNAAADLHGAPAITGELGGTNLVEVLFKLAVKEETGLLTLETDEVSKEVYLLDGDPEYITSSRPEELFGQYLVRRGAITEGELSMALAMLPHFKEKLGDTLVGLKLMRPVQVLRHLTNQVRQKLLDVFTWQRGTYRFYPGKTCQQESAPLGLNAFEIIGAGVGQVPRGRLEGRLARLSQRRLRSVSPAPVPPEVFRLGGLPRRVYDQLNGRHTVEEVLAPFDDPEQRLAFARIIVLLTATGLVG